LRSSFMLFFMVVYEFEYPPGDKLAENTQGVNSVSPSFWSSSIGVNTYSQHPEQAPLHFFKTSVSPEGLWKPQVLGFRRWSKLHARLFVSDDSLMRFSNNSRRPLAFAFASPFFST
jgi:hypothetical protein